MVCVYMGGKGCEESEAGTKEVGECQSLGSWEAWGWSITGVKESLVRVLKEWLMDVFCFSSPIPHIHVYIL